MIQERKIIDDRVTKTLVLKVLQLQPKSRGEEGRQIVQDRVICMGGILLLSFQIFLRRTQEKRATITPKESMIIR